MRGLKITVIIPTYDDWSRLKQCLSALERQSVSSDEFEVIVVDNLIGDDRPSDFHTTLSNVRFLKEAKPGSYSARNKGISDAQADIIGFTDSDCIPQPDWIQTAIKAFSADDIDIIAGDVELFATPKGVENIYDKYEYIFGFPIERYVKANFFGVTANLFVKRKVFNRIGFFNSELKSGGDVDFCQRAKEHGYKIKYLPKLKVNHPTRGTFESLKLKAQRISGKVVDGKNYFIYCFKALGRLRPPISDLRLIFGRDELSFREKWQISVIRYRLKIISSIESLRVLHGKRPNRI